MSSPLGTGPPPDIGGNDRKEKRGMRHYETIYIVSPNVSDNDYGDVVNKFRDILEKNKAITIKVEEWGKQKLAYTIKKNDKGSYILIEYCGGPDLIGRFERDLKLDERILKYQTVKLDDNIDPEALLVKEDGIGEKGAPKNEEIPAEETAQTADSPSNGEVSHGV
jgi:small subunit ribosomal protein S6